MSLDRNHDHDMYDGRYDARSAAALVLLVALFAVLATGLLLLSGEGDNPRSGARVEAPKTPASVPN